MVPGYLLETAQISRDANGNLRSLTFDDIYHSAADGLAEKKHVFLDQSNLEPRWGLLENSYSSRFTIVETGFGLGLNFFLTAELWLNSAPSNSVLYYRSIEKYPLSIEALRDNLITLPLDRQLVADLLARYPQPLQGIHRLWLRPNLCLDLIYDDVLDALGQLQSPVDAWYLDGFSPGRNASMWADEVWPLIAGASKPGTTLATYTAAGSVRRGMAGAGFEVMRQKGFGSKREMLSARFTGSGRPESNRAVAQPLRVAVIGGGLAGTSCAHQLLQRNVQVTLFEARPALGSAASGMYQLAYYPQLASAYDPYCSFSLQAYLYLHSYLQNWQQNTMLAGPPSGLIRLMAQDKIRPLSAQFEPCPMLVQEISATQASNLAGIPVTQGGIFFPLGGWLDPNVLIQAQCMPYAASGQLSIRHDTTVSSLERNGGHWHLQDQYANDAGKFSAVIIANGIQAVNFPQLGNLPLEPVRGQTAVLRCQQGQAEPGVVIAGPVGIFPSLNQKQGVSATYDHGSSDETIRSDDLHWLLDRAGELLRSGNLRAAESRVGIRCVARDRHPVVGPVPNWQDLKNHYAPLARNARTRLAALQDNQNDLYVCTAFGSHGATHIPLCADYLASLICGDPDPLTAESRAVVDPARFMIRDIKKQLA